MGLLGVNSIPHMLGVFGLLTKQLLYKLLVKLCCRCAIVDTIQKSNWLKLFLLYKRNLQSLHVIV